MNSTTNHCQKTTEKTPADPRSLLITANRDIRSWLATCPHAQTLSAYSLALRASVLIPLPCKRWSCRFCAEAKTSFLAARTRDARPNRLMTLTVNPAHYDTPRQAFDETRSKIAPLMRTLRGKFGDVEYLRVTELTRKGWPHYHFLVRSGYLPHSVVRDRWQELTGAQIVDLRPCSRNFRAYTYLLKYLTKMHSIGWTNRHVSYTRKFFPPRPDRDSNSLDLQETEVHEIHLASYLAESCSGATVVEIAPGVYTLNYSPLN